MAMHPRTVVAVERLRHECRSLAVLVSRVADDVFEHLQVIRRLHETGETEIDFALSGGGYFVMKTLDLHSSGFQEQSDLRAKVNERVGRAHGHVAFFLPHAVALIRTELLVKCATGIPVPFV